MMGNRHRVQILLEQEQYQALAEIARREGRSISVVVRELIMEHLGDQERRTRRALDALEALTVMRRRLKAQYGLNQADWLAEIREERDEELDRLLSAEI